MSRITLTGDGNLGTTSVSNVFIDQYMKEANDAQIKVYLYLLRSTSSNRSFEIGDIAEEFNHTEKDVIRALKYWERLGLIALRYDNAGEICGINLIGIKSAQTSAPVLSIVPAPAPKNEEPVKPAVPEKPTYGADDLKAFKEEPGTEELIAITESYLVKSISPSDLRSLLYIHKELAFDFEMTDLLLQYCVSKNKKSFNYIETVATSWYEQGIKTPAQAKTGISRYDRNIFEVMKALGKTGTPTIKEVEFINRWIGSYGFSMDVIFAACERAVMKTDTDRFPYTEGILSKWKKQNLMTLDAVLNAEADYRKSKKSVPVRPVSAPVAVNSSFQKTKYDFAALQKFINEN